MTRFKRGQIRGWLHQPELVGDLDGGEGLVITHGAGSNCESPLIKAVAEAFASGGYHVLRCDLPYRQKRPTGPPRAGDPERDREGLRQAVAAMREIVSGDVILGGHSYGGRQSSMLAAEAPGLVDMLLLLSYPLHPPRQREQLRTAHFPQIQTPALFVHGSRDPFGLIEEMQQYLPLIPARHHLVGCEKKGHELSPDLAPVILKETQCFRNA